ncbi:hypothetical protein JOD54_002359 [Actinokineospora baliensis]|nr:hypothetical protein [Actinokineospora baliensis]
MNLVAFLCPVGLQSDHTIIILGGPVRTHDHPIFLVRRLFHPHARSSTTLSDASHREIPGAPRAQLLQSV